MAQIDDLHARFGRADLLADYFRGLAEIGVARFDSFVTDGHSEFLGAEGQRVVSPPHHELLAIDTPTPEQTGAWRASGTHRRASDPSALRTRDRYAKSGTAAI